MQREREDALYLSQRRERERGGKAGKGRLGWAPKKAKADIEILLEYAQSIVL